MEQIVKCITANPGSGKTKWISEKVIELINNGIDPSKILCLTFTRKARDNMEDRIFKNMGNNVKFPDVETFHSLSLSIIYENFGEASILPERFIRYMLLKYFTKNSVLNYGKHYIDGSYPYIINVGQITNALRFLKSFGIYPQNIDTEKMKIYMNSEFSRGFSIKNYRREEIIKLGEEFVKAFLYYERNKPKNSMDYNDVISFALQIIRENPLDYDYVFVDEMQDMNQLEMELAKKCGQNLTVVGDKKQAIFGFQGGLINVQINKSNEKDVLSSSWRLYSGVVQYVKSFMNDKLVSNDDINDLENLHSAKEGEGGNVKLYICQSDEKKLAVLNIIKNMKSEDFPVGIIVRTNDQASEMAEVLEENNINFRKISGSTGFEDERNDIVDFISGIFSDSPEDIIRMIYSSYSGIDLREALELSDKIRRSEYSGKKFEPSDYLNENLINLRKKYNRRYSDVIRLFDEYIVPESIMSEKKFRTAKDMRDSLSVFIKIFGDIDHCTLEDIRDYLSQPNAMDTDDDNEEKGNINIITVHKAKGLQFKNVVYVPLPIEKRNPSPVDFVVEAIGDQFNLKYGLQEREAEEARIDFVAMTRTENNLYIVIDQKNKNRYYNENCTMEEFKFTRNEFISLLELKKSDEKKSDQWLLKFMEKKLKDFRKVSYSMLSTVNKIHEFILNYILNYRRSEEALDFGTSIHSMIENYIKSNKKPENLKDEDRKAWEHFLKYEEELKKIYNATWNSSEKKYIRRAKEIFPDVDTDLLIEGRIDAVAKMNNGKYIVIDFKTSKRTDMDDHSKQLSLYTKMFSIEENKTMDEIYYDIVYLLLRDERVNIGNYNHHWEIREGTEIEDKLQYVKSSLMEFERMRNDVKYLASKVLQDDKEYNSYASRLFKRFREEIFREMN
ncbi:UvrD-helicase domain-containing protein [Caldiplasma sukawensis]